MDEKAERQWTDELNSETWKLYGWSEGANGNAYATLEAPATDRSITFLFDKRQIGRPTVDSELLRRACIRTARGYKFEPVGDFTAMDLPLTQFHVSREDQAFEPILLPRSLGLYSDEELRGLAEAVFEQASRQP